MRLRLALLSAAVLGHSLSLDAQGRRAGPATASAPDSALAEFAGLTFRNIGPSRGGRSVAVSGVRGMPLTYFAGYTGGGLWRTDDAGISWRNISDGQFRVGTIGAIAVANSDRNVIYVGTGEHAIRGQSSTYGDGVYKSTDFGRSWTHIGLETTRQISAVRVHPDDANTVYVAAQGDRWQGSTDRGIYRSKDGGATWQNVLRGQNPTSGPSDLSMDPTNPRILYAAFWDHQRQPWYVRSGGAGSGIWKSTDGGDTWTRLTQGLPALMGKIGVAVSPANPDRVFAIVEAENGGLFRSNDAGRTWRRLSGDRLIQTRSWYYMKVFADPKNENIVWVLNAPVLRSIDGGSTFATVQATHGDNHALWLDPDAPERMINGNDGGASISLDGGKSWSSQDNQPTAQFYHVTVDDAFPYRLYSGQQDNSAVVIKGFSDGGSIGIRDWDNTAGCESANIGVSARDSRYVYGGCYQGLLDELDQQTGLSRAIMVYPAMNLTERTDSTKYRFNWTAPIRVSEHDARTIYYGGNALFRTTDRGTTWAPISPDLTRNDRARQGWGGGPITNEGAGGEVYGTIVVIAESPHDARTLYTGSDDGLIQRTTDGGATWTNVTPAAAGDGLVNEIEVSPHDANTVYLAFRKERVGDPTPHIFRSTDAGRSWTRIVDGLRAGEPVRVVREDPARRGMLYAGTETGIYFSVDNGARWTAFSSFPKVPVTDLDVRHDDLVISTEGRAFWILDDLRPLRAAGTAVPEGGVQLLGSRGAVLTSAGGGFGGGAAANRVGRNPDYGATIHYRLTKADSSTRATLEISNARGEVVRTFSTAATGRNRIQTRNGLNRVVWDLRYEGPTTLPNVVLFGAPPGNGGPRVLPGQYTAKLTVGSSVLTTSFEVKRDPRLAPVNERVLVERDSIARLLNRRIGEMHDYVVRLRDIRTQVSGIVQRTSDHAQADSVKLLGGRVTGGTDRLEPKLTTKAGNGQDIINYANGLNGQFGFLLGQVEEHPELTQPVRERLAEVEVRWTALRTELETFEATQLAALNAFLQRNGLPHVIVTARQRPAPIM
jgi:photosystem II stability/assembly factor-like uncharacterized protein